MPNTSQAHAAYLFLEEKIVSLELRPGSALTEKQIIEQVGLGRTPVREAIQRLSWEGLLEIVPRSGIRISDIRPEDYLRVMEPRLALEPIFARKAARFADASHRAHLAECASLMETAAKTSNVSLFLKADKTFDAILETACANPFLSKVLSPLQTHSRRFWVRYSSNRDLSASATLHVRVMKDITRQDEEAADTNMTALMEALSSIARSLVR
ncbi:GntR family transcriptional regulator [Stappia sp. ES.058]|uniref:GntR family transcriptional regulator n=1 Tax=Stappia sp. ES.058 TaxID=1881061 RepID=UPI000879C10C|nr:GntR family transcriptional regulator [Stappia sp. ES.058]SDU03882.1 DNA-binding transcriptional regulator, GntR family [Stappia sp. ES.058]